MAAVLNAFLHLEVTLYVSEKKPTRRYWHDMPLVSAVSIDPSPAVWLSPGMVGHPAGFAYALHELEHILFWTQEHRMDVPEQLMMPWGVGVLRAGGVPASRYFDNEWTSITMLPELWIGSRKMCEVNHWRRPLRAGWYRRALQANIAAGTLTPSGLPTWKRPDWSAIDYGAHCETYDVTAAAAA